MRLPSLHRPGQRTPAQTRQPRWHQPAHATAPPPQTPAPKHSTHNTPPRRSTTRCRQAWCAATSAPARQTAVLIDQLEARRENLVVEALDQGWSVREVANAAQMSSGWVHKRRNPDG